MLDQTDQRQPLNNDELPTEMNQEFDSKNNGKDSSGRGIDRSNNNGSSNRGFAAMSPERQKQIASEGGRAAHKQGVAHEWNSDEARRAGKKGGQMVSQNREHMSEIGRRGGQSSGGRRNKNQQSDNGTPE